MMRYSLLIACMVFFITACKEAEPPHMPREKMLAVLEDIHMAEVYSSIIDAGEERTTNKNIDSLVKYYNIVLDAHNITLEEFNQSMEWYARHPAELDSVYVNMLTQLNELDGILSNTGK